MRVLVFDTETGDTDENGPGSLLQVGVVAGDLDTGEVFQQDEWLHKLPSLRDYHIEDGAFEIHKISADKAFAEGVPTADLQELFVDSYHANNCVLLGGHNVQPFDVPWVRTKLFGTQRPDSKLWDPMSKREFESTFTYRSLDTMPLVRFTAGIEGMKQGATLKQAAKSLGIDVSDLAGGFHGALYDAIVTFRIMHKYRRFFMDPEVVERLLKA